MKLLSFNT